MHWEQDLMDHLMSLSPTERLLEAAQAIDQISHNTLAALATMRRQTVLDILALPGWDATRLAEEIGSRRDTITRLAEEARRQGLVSPLPVP
jgi:hypothetical protein